MECQLPYSHRRGVAQLRGENSRAVFVLVSCWPSTEMPFDARNSRSCGDVEAFPGRALRGQLDDARAVRVEPHLGDDAPVEVVA